MRNKRDVGAFHGRDSGTADERILVSVTTRDTPLRRYDAIQSKLVTIRSLTSRLENSRRVIWIGSPRVGAVLAIERGRQR